jgi:hypothetical protein
MHLSIIFRKVRLGRPFDLVWAANPTIKMLSACESESGVKVAGSPERNACITTLLGFPCSLKEREAPHTLAKVVKIVPRDQK